VPSGPLDAAYANFVVDTVFAGTSAVRPNIEHRGDTERFLDELRSRLAEFSLELHPGKTRLIEFGRHAARHRAAQGEPKPETFAFGEIGDGDDVVRRRPGSIPCQINLFGAALTASHAAQSSRTSRWRAGRWASLDHGKL
jgi:hypothetical protein